MEGNLIDTRAVGGDSHVHLRGIIGVQVIAVRRLSGNGALACRAFLGEAVKGFARFIHILHSHADGAHGPHIAEFHPVGVRTVLVHGDVHLGGAVRGQGKAVQLGGIDHGVTRLVGFLGAFDHIARVVDAHHFHRRGLHRRAIMELHRIGGTAAVGVHGDINRRFAHALHAGRHAVIGVDPAVIGVHRDGGFGDHLAGHGVDIAHGDGGFGDLRNHGLLAGQGGGVGLAGDIQPQGGRRLAQAVKGHNFHIVHPRLGARVHVAQLGQGQAIQGDFEAGGQGEAGILARQVGHGQPGVGCHRVLGRVQPQAVFIAGRREGSRHAGAGMIVPEQGNGYRQRGHLGLGRNQAAQGRQGQQRREHQRSQPPDQVSLHSHFHKRLLGGKITK